VNVRSNAEQSFNNFAQQATVFGTNYAGTIATNNITFGIAQAPYSFTGTNFEGAERFGRFFGDLTSIIQGALEDIGAGAGEVLSLGFATVPAGAVAIHGTAVAYGSGGRAISEAWGLADYFARDRSGSSGGKMGGNQRANKQFDDAVKDLKINDRNGFSKFLHKEKERLGKGGSDNFTWQQLQQLGEKFRQNGGN
jgi:hypothetical protein